MSKIELRVDIDLDAIQKTIIDATKLGNNNSIFEALAQIEKAKQEFLDSFEVLLQAERDVKITIDGKAKTEYGEEWDVIVGTNYQIGKSLTGALYVPAQDLTDVPEEFLTVRRNLDSIAVDKYIVDNGTLPDGVEYNPSRGRTIKIKVQLPVEEEEPASE